MDFKVNKEAIHTLAEILNDTGLTEIEYKTEHGSIRVVKTGMVQVAHAPLPQAQPVLQAKEEVKVDPNQHPGAVKSPMVGTAYLSPEPSAQAFVKVGDSVKEGQTIVIIEAMKVMNQIKAPKAGRVIQICIQDATPVEFNEIMMVIE